MKIRNTLFAAAFGIVALGASSAHATDSASAYAAAVIGLNSISADFSAVDYEFNNGSQFSDYTHSGHFGGGYGTDAFYWPSLDGASGYISSEAYAQVHTAGDYGVLTEQEGWAVTFTNSSKSDQLVSFNLGGAYDLETNQTGNGMSYAGFGLELTQDGSTLGTLSETIYSAPGVLNGYHQDTNSATLPYSFTLGAGQTTTFEFFEGTIAYAQATPEPASLAVLGVGAVALLRRRKKA